MRVTPEEYQYRQLSPREKRELGKRILREAHEEMVNASPARQKEFANRMARLRKKYGVPPASRNNTDVKSLIAENARLTARVYELEGELNGRSV